jgi:hypothetical protein
MTCGKGCVTVHTITSARESLLATYSLLETDLFGTCLQPFFRVALRDSTSDLQTIYLPLSTRLLETLCPEGRLTWPSCQGFSGCVVIPRSELDHMSSSQIVFPVELRKMLGWFSSDQEPEQRRFSVQRVNANRGPVRAHVATKLVLSFESSVPKVPPTICLTSPP